MTEKVDNELNAIEATAISYLTAFNRADVAGVLSTYADDGVLMGPGRPASIGKDALAAAYPAVFEAIEFAMAYDIKEVAQISPDWGFVRSATVGKETNRATGITAESAYQELFLMRRTAGMWRIARYCTTKISPAA
ncbi:YybH family protein [Sphingomonas sp. MMS24-J45]|uniref:YybH family protein n=1 Tax=Sphingomonas sp. MMS24-J45 TaxID=3238806 RepID=UPI00384AF352